MLTVAMVVGISVHETTLGTTVANLGFDSVTFPNPMFHGDTLRVETEVLAARASSSRPGQGIVTFEHPRLQPARPTRVQGRPPGPDARPPGRRGLSGDA